MTTDEVQAPTCQSCLKTIQQREVVALGDSLFHVECFNCAKCKKSVNNKSNLLVLNDGRPLCAQCSSQCSACHQNIGNEAILTNDQAYHAECFKCSSCQRLITDLIFLQTEKGIYCADCQQQPKQLKGPVDIEIRTEFISTDSLSPKPEPNVPTTNDSFFTDLTLSFFESDDNELSNLSNSLGANLHLNPEVGKSKNNNLRESTIITQSRLNRASEILEKSLRTTSLIQTNPEIESSTFDEDNRITKDLEDSQLKLKELETNYKLLQEASQQALIEFNKIKEDYAKESRLKQKLEYSVITLLRKNGKNVSKSELNELASLKIELERTCKELADDRDKIALSIQENIDNSLILTDYQHNLKTQINSLILERDHLKSQTNELQSTRDEIINDIVILNTKNSELTHMNNDLSRRALEQRAKRSDIPETSPPLSPSQSTESTSLPFPSRRTRKASDAASVFSFSSKLNDQQSLSSNNFTRTLKKKGSSMFSKLAGTTKKPEPTLSKSTSSSMFRTTTKQSGIYGNQSFNNSVQSVAMSIKESKKFMESSLSLSDCLHSFQSYSFIRPVKCGLCNEKMWGRSEYRCDQCGLLAHSRCLNKVTQDNFDSSSLDLPSAGFMHPSVSSSSSFDERRTRSKKSFSENALFGSSLSDRCKFENRKVPLIVEECVKEVELRGLDYEGIYRKSGGAAQIRTIQLAYEQGKHINLHDENEFNDICAITSALKQYFRELSDPLLTFDSYDKFIDVSVMENNDKKIHAFSEILLQLPKSHYDTMSFLFNHLQKVVENASLNRMTVKNLAMVFAPTLMRHNDPSKDFLDISYKNATIEYILLNTDKLFT